MEISVISKRQTTGGVVVREWQGWLRTVLTDAWLVVFAGVVVLSLLPDTNPAMAIVSPVWADLAHVPVYMVLTLLTVLLVSARIHLSFGLLAMIVFCISLFGGLVEVLQQLVGRTASLADMAWNGTGAVLAATGYYVWTKCQMTTASSSNVSNSSRDALSVTAVQEDPNLNSIRLDETTPGDEWDAYVDGHPCARVYHRLVWRDIIRSVFGHQSVYLCARRGRAIVGILPLVRLKSRLFGDYFVSMPYFNYGGALAESAEISRQLMDAAAARAMEFGCSHIEFRDTEARSVWPVRTDKVAMELPLPADPDVLWSEFTPKLRAQIRKPQKEGAEFVWGGSELLPEFYRIFAHNMRDLGTPVYPKMFFQTILHTFPRHANIALVRYQQRPVAGGFLLGYRDRLEIPWASSLREFNRLGVNMLLYSEVLKRAIEEGYTLFDFGRSTRDTGTYNFKKQWGAQERALYWHYWLATGQAMPNLTPKNPKYRLAIGLWKKLPLAVTNVVGPWLVGNLP